MHRNDACASKLQEDIKDCHQTNQGPATFDLRLMHRRTGFGRMTPSPAGRKTSSFLLDGRSYSMVVPLLLLDHIADWPASLIASMRRLHNEQPGTSSIIGEYRRSWKPWGSSNV